MAPEAIPAEGVVVRKCSWCGKHFSNQLWNGYYVCPQCRDGNAVHDAEEYVLEKT